MKKASLLVSMLITILILISCSRNTDPMTPGMTHLTDPGALSPINTQQVSQAGITGPDRGVFGAWKVRVETKSMTAEILPARNAQAIGNIFDADLSQFLTVSPCANCLRIPRIAYDDYDDLLMEVAMKHPFSNAAARPDLHGFDVRAIFILTPYYMTSYPDIDIMKPDGTTEDVNMCMSELSLMNADGYTSHYDWLTTDERYFIGGTDIPGNINPFLRFFDDFNTDPFDPLAPAGHNVMPVGAGYKNRIAVLSQAVLFDIFEFYIIADVAYGQSAVLANRTNPQYYLPAFNRTEPWRVEYWIENNTLAAFNPLSTADLVVQVFDWQHGATVDPTYPDPANKSGIPEASDVLQLELSIPGYQDDPIIATTPESGTGSPADPLQYRLTVTNSNQIEVSVWGLLAVRDQLYGQAAPSGRLPIPVSPSGFPYETADIRDYSLYVPVYVNMKHPMFMFYHSTDIDGELVYDFEDTYARWGTTSIGPTFFQDPGHSRFKYEWDYDYDTVTFDVDGSGLPSPDIAFATGGRYNVGLRVSTDSVPPREYTYSLPVFAGGEAFTKTLGIAGDKADATSWTKNHSAYLTEDGLFYQVYDHVSGTDRDIFLSATDSSGNTTTITAVDSPNVCFCPSMTVIENGPNAGIYIAYSEVEGSNAFLYATYGNLNGTGFGAPHQKRLSTKIDAWEFYPIVCVVDNSLCVYYMDTVFVFSQLAGAHSDDFGQIWNNDGAIVDNTSLGQVYPTAVTGYSGVDIIWSDYLNGSTNGSDLWMANSIDGFTFTDLQNISSIQGLLYENYPSAVYRNGQIAIAYNVQPESSSLRDVRLKILNLQNNSVTDYLIAKADAASSSFTQPSIACSTGDRYTIAYGERYLSTNYFYGHAKEIIASSPSMPGNFYARTLFDQSMGPVDTLITEIYPIVLSTSPQFFVVENLISWTNFEMGYSDPASTPTEYFGDLRVTNYLTDKDTY